MCIIWSTPTWMQCWPQHLGCIWQIYLHFRGSEGAVVAHVRCLGGPELLSISVGDLFPTYDLILNCSFERRTVDTHRANCRGWLTTVSNSIKDNIQRIAVCAFKPRRGNLRKRPFSWHAWFGNFSSSVDFNVPRMITHLPQYLRFSPLYTWQHKFEGNASPASRVALA